MKQNRTPEEWYSWICVETSKRESKHGYTAGTQVETNYYADVTKEALRSCIEQGRREAFSQKRQINAWWIDLWCSDGNIYRGQCDLEDKVEDGEEIIIVVNEWRIPCVVKNVWDASVSFEAVL